MRRFGVMHRPGMADDLMHELAPLLAVDGIDFNDPSTMDFAALNEALSRATRLRGFHRHWQKPHLSVDRALPHHRNTK